MHTRLTRGGWIIANFFSIPVALSLGHFKIDNKKNNEIIKRFKFEVNGAQLGTLVVLDERSVSLKRLSHRKQTRE